MDGWVDGCESVPSNGQHLNIIDVTMKVCTYWLAASHLPGNNVTLRKLYFFIGSPSDHISKVQNALSSNVLSARHFGQFKQVLHHFANESLM